MPTIFWAEFLIKIADEPLLWPALSALVRGERQFTSTLICFDEAANIQFAEQLEEYGIHVTYGVVGLKTHCKVILVVRQDYNGLRRYAHIGTGDYHAGTARLYADFGLLTSDDALGADLTQLFNFLTTGHTRDALSKRSCPRPRCSRGRCSRTSSARAIPGLLRISS